MRIIDCAGPPLARGRAHGESLRAEIAEALARWEAARLAGPAAARPASIIAYAAALIGRTRLLEAVRRLTPALHEEVRGIAEGAGQPFELIAAWNLMDEQWWFDGLDGPPPGCSLVALPVVGGHVLAQTMDLPAHLDGAQVALRLGGPDMSETVVLSAAGQIGLTGLNAAGVAIGVNTLLNLTHDAGALPIAFALRHALLARSAGEAAARLAGVGHASGQHWAVVDGEGFRSLECSGGGCVAYRPEGPILHHANDPLASTDLDPKAEARVAGMTWAASSRARLAWLKEAVRGGEGIAEVQAIFDDESAPICLKRGGASVTFAGVLYFLGHRPVARMRAGPAGSGDWTHFDFDKTGDRQ